MTRRRRLAGLAVVVLGLVFGSLLPVPPPVAAAELTDPRFPADFPDPAVLRVGPLSYAYATNGRGNNVQVISSTDLQTWQRLPDALPRLPVWAAANFTWAHSVLARGPGGAGFHDSAGGSPLNRPVIGMAA